MNLQKRSLLLSTLLLAVLLALPLEVGIARASSNRPCGDWSDSATLAPSKALSSSLSAVTTVTRGNVWSVGNYYNSKNVARTLIEHWNGHKWSIIPSPNAGQEGNYLAAVAAVSADDIWAVGSYQGTERTLLEHWNGEQWSIVPGLSPGTNVNYLAAVTAISADNVWAVGFFADEEGSDSTLVEHWNGKQWSIISSPNIGEPDQFNYLLGITAITHNNIWAVGGYAGDPVSGLTLIEHWDGKQWSIVPSPPLKKDTIYSNLDAVTAVSADNVWSVGVYDSNSTSDQTLIEHWNGKQWNVVESANSTQAFNNLTSIAAVAKNDIWSVGYSYNTTNPQDNGRTLIEHWNGKQWSIVHSANTGSHENILSGVSAYSATDIWTVGYSYRNVSNSQPLTSFYCKRA